MSGQYSTKSFFRHMPNAMLASYFNEKELFGDIDFSAMKEGKPDELFKQDFRQYTQATGVTFWNKRQ